jgi:hypothetical protein
MFYVQLVCAHDYLYKYCQLQPSTKNIERVFDTLQQFCQNMLFPLMQMNGTFEELHICSL